MRTSASLITVDFVHCCQLRRCYVVAMKLTIELKGEDDGRWIAEVPELNLILYGIRRLMQLSEPRRHHARSFSTGWLVASCPPDSADAVFDTAA